MQLRGGGGGAKEGFKDSKNRYWGWKGGWEAPCDGYKRVVALLGAVRIGGTEGGGHRGK